MFVPTKMPTHGYVGRCRKCNGVIASIADIDDDKYCRRITAQSVAGVIRDGHIIERAEFGTVLVNGCSCGKEPTPETPLPLFAQD